MPGLGIKSPAVDIGIGIFERSFFNTAGYDQEVTGAVSTITGCVRLYVQMRASGGGGGGSKTVYGYDGEKGTAGAIVSSAYELTGSASYARGNGGSGGARNTLSDSSAAGSGSPATANSTFGSLTATGGLGGVGASGASGSLDRTPSSVTNPDGGTDGRGGFAGDADGSAGTQDGFSGNAGSLWLTVID